MDEIEVEIPRTPYIELAQQSVEDYLEANGITTASEMTADNEGHLGSLLREIVTECPYLHNTVIASSDHLFMTIDDECPNEHSALILGSGRIRGVLLGFSITTWGTPKEAQFGLAAILSSTAEVDEQEAEERYVVVPLDGESVVTAFLPEFLN